MRRIVDGVLAPETRLHESRLAEEFRISRAPVRQALAALEEQGLIRRLAGQGYAINPPRPGRAMPPLAAIPDEGQIVPTASWEAIYRDVEMAIVSRTSVASWRIIEAEIARFHGVSRTVAREVVARLNQRGLIKRDDRARWYAPALTSDYILELYEMRWTLEPVALTRASSRAPPGCAGQLRASLNDALARAESLTGGELDRLEAELHVDYLGHCDNGTLIEALRLSQSLLVAHTFLYALSPAPYRVEPFLPEHAAVIDALAAGRVAAAARALEAHLRAASERAVARVEMASRDIRVAELPYMLRLSSR
jgi:DNA-binding GntR family transcriptional regulator